MPSPEFNQQNALSGDGQGSSEYEEEHSELKALVDAIAAQLSDATRRHSETLGEMQDRIAVMGREAEVLRDHIPEQFAPTFEHIEAGVAELAKRLARANDSDAVANQDANPWDHDNAEALSNVFETHGRKSAEVSSAAYASPVFAPQASIDQAWFEARFAEIARDIEQSLAEIRPDRGFHQIGERLDQFEQRFSGLLESVATRADLDSVRLIEEHVSEVVNHLVQTQDQLARLTAIEDQLAAITQTLSGGNETTLSGVQTAMAMPGSGLDVEAIARAAAEQTAMRFAGMGTGSHEAAGELRPLIERMMEENRSGGENTSALLDTMQQAMIRLLDRVDEIEFAQRKDAPIPQASFEDFATAPPPLPEYPFQTGESDHDPLDFSDEIASPVRPEAMPSARDADPFEHENAIEQGARKNEKLRQDFIAEARRAKMRLSSTADDDIVVTSPMHSDTFSMSSPDAVRGPQGSRPIRPTATRSKASGPSGPSPRLIVLAVAALLALGGLWFTVGSDTPAPVAGSSTSVSPAASHNDGKSGAGTNVPDQKGNGAQSPEAGGRGDQQGQLIPGGTGTANTNVSMLGVAVDLNSPATEASMQQAQRHQAMAELSGKLGDAASQANNAALVPASMVPTEAETEGAPGAAAAAPSSDVTGQMRFELPPATVGPLSLRLAAANGDASAEFEVGARIAEGKGTPQDFKDAAKWYRRAADQGLAPAQYRLGTFYERGLGMKADRAQAEAWYKRAATKGNVKAMHNLAVLSANQNDQSPDYTTAAQWFEQAAKRGLADSQFNLAILYENGLGVSKDLKQAYMWISLAAQDKDADAVRRQGSLRSKLTAKDLSEAERMIGEWRAVPVDRTVNDARLVGEEWKKTPTKSIAG